MTVQTAAIDQAIHEGAWSMALNARKKQLRHDRYAALEPARTKGELLAESSSLIEGLQRLAEVSDGRIIYVPPSDRPFHQFDLISPRTSKLALYGINDEGKKGKLLDIFTSDRGRMTIVHLNVLRQTMGGWTLKRRAQRTLAKVTEYALMENLVKPERLAQLSAPSAPNPVPV